MNMKDLDWSRFPSSMPREGVVRPTGKAREALVTRIKRAWAKLPGNCRTPDEVMRAGI